MKKEFEEILSLTGITKRWIIAVFCIYFTYILFGYHLHSYTIAWFIVSFTGSFIMKIKKVSNIIFKERDWISEVISLPIAFFLTMIPSMIIGMYNHPINIHTIFYSFIACSIITFIVFFINKIVSIQTNPILHFISLLIVVILTSYILCIIDIYITYLYNVYG